MDMSSIAAAVSSLQAAGDIAKALINLKTMTEVQSMAIELNTKIIDAQHHAFGARGTFVSAFLLGNAIAQC